MKIGIIGSPQTGKTTLFESLTKGTTQVSQSRTNVAAVSVADADLDFLASVFKPKRRHRPVWSSLTFQVYPRARNMPRGEMSF